jgi:hypothetical protein
MIEARLAALARRGPTYCTDFLYAAVACTGGTVRDVRGAYSRMLTDGRLRLRGAYVYVGQEAL